MDADVALDSNVRFLLRALNERNDNARFTTASGSTASMLVRLTVFWRVIMNHTVDAFNVNATRSDIGCHECHAFSVLEALHGHVTTALA